MWEFDIFTAKHDDIKTGSYQEIWSRVVLSDQEFPNPYFAAETAACLAMAVHGGMATKILFRL